MSTFYMSMLCQHQKNIFDYKKKSFSTDEISLSPCGVEQQIKLLILIVYLWVSQMQVPISIQPDIKNKQQPSIIMLNLCLVITSTYHIFRLITRLLNN